jgi:two-component system, OmpR family, alkaline phosphatase synthesis response regulator PhoP
MAQKVLIADDEPFIRLLLEQALEELEDGGVELLTARDGREALEMIQTEKPQLVFLDVMMPGMNGYEVCHEVKHVLKLEGVFIIMLTAKGQEFDKIKGEEVGADIYMTKPFDPDEVVEKAEEILGL